MVFRNRQHKPAHALYLYTKYIRVESVVIRSIDPFAASTKFYQKMNSDDDNAVIVLSDSDVEKDDESSLFSNDESDVDEEVLLFFVVLANLISSHFDNRPFFDFLLIRFLL
jgi:2',3'-cyclic-nucleotide 2'-phosphodiesterase (5'-nucleotidase family)